jgi:hypothetical protein
MSDPKDPMAELMATAITTGTNVLKAAETTILTMVPIVGNTMTAVIVVWGGKSIIMNVIELIDRAIDIKKT